MTPFIQHKAEIWDGSNNYHWEVTAGDDFLHIKYKEKGRVPQESDSFEIPVELAEALSKTIIQLLSMKGEK